MESWTKWCWCNPDGNADRLTDYITIASDITNPYNGYAVESSIKLDAIPALDKKVGEGNIVGFHCSLDDADGKAEPDPHDDMSFGDIKFVGPAAVSPQSKITTAWGALKDN